eukprot:COSAG02_NODE_31045_length_540_cov_0.981859_1_plen_76_part_01
MSLLQREGLVAAGAVEVGGLACNDHYDAAFHAVRVASATFTIAARAVVRVVSVDGLTAAGVDHTLSAGDGVLERRR